MGKRFYCTLQQRQLLVKTIIYRVLGIVTTIASAFIILGEIKEASSIGVLDFVVKTINYYGYEFIWSYIKWGKGHNETRLRSFIKSLLLRVEATLITLAISYAFTAEIATSIWIAVFEAVEKIILYYTFERVWQYLKVWLGGEIIIVGDSIAERRRHCFGYCQTAVELP